MRNKKIQEYIDLLDETIQLEEQEDYKEDTEEYRQGQIRIFNFGEIKQILSEVGNHKPDDDEELVGDFKLLAVECGRGNVFDSCEFRRGGLKLLQERNNR